MSEVAFGAAPRTPPVSISSISTEVNQTGSWKYIQPAYHDRVAPCSAGCPTGVDIQGYMSLLREGRISEAIELLQLENPMPAITGRVCNHPCEDQCNRGTFDGAVAIHAVERMLGDLALQSPRPDLAARQHSERVAVIGSGPAGLACAYHLTRLGYRAEVFEREPELGGMLRIGIPEYRLPREVLDLQLARYMAQGIVFHMGVRVGTDVSWEDLTSTYAAVFIASGAHVSKLLKLAGGEPAANVLSGLDFLRAVNRGERPNLGQRVIIVIGGGNTAMDCARTALRLGAEVTVVYRRTRDEMPAIAEEITDAEREGVNFVYLAAPAGLAAEEGRLTLSCERMQLGASDPHGRRRVTPSAEPRLELTADSIITAIGEDADLACLPAQMRGGRVQVDEWGGSRVANIFLGGDVAGDERTVATALGAGKRAAIGIDRYLRHAVESASEPSTHNLRIGEVGNVSMARWTGTDPVHRVNPRNSIVTADEVNTSYFAQVQRNEDRQVEHHGSFAETNEGLSHAAALAEAARCFQCGVCNECELCQIYCSEAAIRIDPTGASRFIIDLEHCKGCGVCAAECPRGAIMMERLSALGGES